jgi:hypothetical protein
MLARRDIRLGCLAAYADNGQIVVWALYIIIFYNL